MIFLYGNHESTLSLEHRGGRELELAGQDHRWASRGLQLHTLASLLDQSPEQKQTIQMRACRPFDPQDTERQMHRNISVHQTPSPSCLSFSSYISLKLFLPFPVSVPVFQCQYTHSAWTFVEMDVEMEQLHFCSEVYYLCPPTLIQSIRVKLLERHNGKNGMELE